MNTRMFILIYMIFINCFEDKGGCTTKGVFNVIFFHFSGTQKILLPAPPLHFRFKKIWVAGLVFKKYPLASTSTNL